MKTMKLSRGQVEERLAVALREYVGLCGRVRRALAKFYGAKGKEAAEEAAEVWSVANLEARAAARSLEGIEATFHKHGGRLVGVVERLDEQLLGVRTQVAS